MKTMKKAGFILMLTFLFAGCSSVLMTGRKQLNLVSDAQVLAMSDSSYRSYMAGAIISKNATQSTMVTRVGKNVANAVQNYLAKQGQSGLIEGYSWEFKLVVDAAVNAFCMPGGKIVVYEGILPVTSTETGLAVVVAHEVAHAVAKHANERISQQIAASYGAAAVDALLQNKTDLVRTIGSVVFGLGAEYGVMLPYSRKQEYEADRLGLIFMALAGYDPAKAITFWERMSAQATNQMPEFMSTHPTDAKREANMKTYLPEAQTYYKK